jgi:hypothetical protein
MNILMNKYTPMDALYYALLALFILIVAFLAEPCRAIATDGWHTTVLASTIHYIRTSHMLIHMPISPSVLPHPNNYSFHSSLGILQIP